MLYIIYHMFQVVQAEHVHHRHGVCLPHHGHGPGHRRHHGPLQNGRRGDKNIKRKIFILMIKIIGLQPRPDLEHERVPGQGLRWRPPLHRPQPRQHLGGRVREDAQRGDASVQ